MAPWSVPELRQEEDDYRCRRVFNEARTRDAAARASVFEEAWFALSPTRGLPYPSSALLAQHVWRSKLSLALCEASLPVADEIDGWLGCREARERLAHGVLLPGDWRGSARGPLFLDVDADCLFIEMDPYRYDSRVKSVRKKTDAATVYPEDLTFLGQHLAAENRPIILQLSSFSAQNGNSPEVIEASVRGVLEPCHFLFRDRVGVDGQMQSLVFVRNLTISGGPLQPTFSTWLAGIG
jgi:hypothetical protein